VSTLPLNGTTEFGTVVAQDATADRVGDYLALAAEDWLQKRRDRFPFYPRPPEFTVMKHPTTNTYVIGWYLEVPARHLKETR